MSADFIAAVRVYGDEVHYGASSLGSCTRALAAARQELEPWRGKAPEGIQKAYDRGNDLEPKALDYLRSNGWTVVKEQEEVRVKLSRRLFVVGHIDGIGVNLAKDGYNVEVKSQNDEEWAKPSIQDSIFWPKYRWQMSSYWLAVKLPMLVVRINEAGECKSELIKPSVFYTFQEVFSRVLEVEQLAHTDLATVECDKKDFPCPYWKLLHPAREVDELERVDVDDTELASWVIHLARANVEKAEAEKVYKNLRQKIIERVKAGFITRDRTTGVAVKVTKHETGQRVIPPGTMVRVTPMLPETKEESDDGD